MWTWDQSAGELRRNGEVIAKGYSGKGKGKNNPALETVRATGPIPRGKWKIVGPPYNSSSVGPYALKVFADDGRLDDTHARTGRGAFRIHGDNKTGTASEGCIILGPAMRRLIWESGDRDLEVVE
jgi:hypothetical protein